MAHCSWEIELVRLKGQRTIGPVWTQDIGTSILHISVEDEWEKTHMAHIWETSMNLLGFAIKEKKKKKRIEKEISYYVSLLEF